MKSIICLVIALMPLLVLSKGVQYPVFTIPESLKENADAVVRLHEKTIEVNGINEIITHEKFVVTIFNKSARDLGYFIEHHDKITSLSNYSVKLYNELGVQIDKSKVKDFKDEKAFSSSLFDDNRILKYKMYYDKYPYTIEYSFTRRQKQTMNIDYWMPICDYNVSIENAKVNYVFSQLNQARFLVKNIPGVADSIHFNTKLNYSFELNDYLAVENESFMPNMSDYLPNIRVAPINFSYDGLVGDMTSWETYGIWTWDLLKNRSDLSENSIAKIKQLTQDATNDKERIKILYEYLQNNTRYVSIQLGIGGYQPFEPTFVEETQYGDCKALSNYMRALLKAINIESNYVEIKAGKYRNHFVTNFPSNQTNHIILCVPNKGDTIWLECTNQRQPFGFLGSFTSNRHALEVSENGGKLIKTPAYKTMQNTQCRTINATYNEGSKLECSALTTYSGLQYENVERYLYLDAEKQKKALYEYVDISGLDISNFSLNHGGDIVPKANLELNFTIDNYGQVNGSRLFVPLNVLNKYTFVPKKLKERNYPIKTNWTGFDSDTVIMDLPNNYKIEYLPDEVNLETAFGHYQTSIKVNENQIIYIRNLTLHKSIYEASQYADFRKFFKQVVKFDDDKMILIESN